MKYKVIEYFTSINGEGLKSGQLTTFIRFVGCNLRCVFCDSKYTYDKDEKYEVMTDKQILEYVAKTGIKNVTLAGGEPLFQPNIKELVKALCDSGFNVEIETNGSHPIKEMVGFSNRPSFTLDYKTGCSGGMSKYMNTENYAYITKHDSVKFVVGSKSDLEQMLDVITEYDLIEKTNVLVSPCYGEIELLDIVEYMKAHKLNGVRMQIQLHKIVWNAEARGV